MSSVKSLDLRLDSRLLPSKNRQFSWTCVSLPTKLALTVVSSSAFFRLLLFFWLLCLTYNVPLSFLLLKTLQPTRFGSLTWTLLFSGLLCALCSSPFKLVTLCPILLVSSKINVRCCNRHHYAFLLTCLNRCTDYSTFPCQNIFYSSVRTNW